uniref:Uncharacterized protein n=1 Tax=Rhizophora mucronata TaxID=61149 RepID=A0A2P2QZT7_RHIMU
MGKQQYAISLLEFFFVIACIKFLLFYSKSKNVNDCLSLH